MMFSSRPPYNDDPMPYVVRGDNNTWRNSPVDAQFIIDHPQVYSPRFAVKHDPRSTFDRPQNNPTNPILDEFRSIYHETAPTIYQGYWELAEIWLELLDADPPMEDTVNWGALVEVVTWPQIHHARRVLTRLARVAS